MAQDLSKLKILKIAPSVFSPPKFSSGIKTYTLTLKKHLRDRGIKVHILGASLDGGSNRGDILVRIPKKSDFLFSLYAIPAYMKIKGEYDLIHISDPFFTLPLLLFATKKPSVLTLHEVWSDAVSYKRGYLTGIVARIVEYLSLRKVQDVIVVEERLKKTYIEKYPWVKKKMHVIGVGVDLDSFKPLEEDVRERFGFFKRDKIILFVGRLEKEKNVSFLLLSFKHVKEKEPDAKLVLVGDGKDKKKLESLARELSLKDVYFMEPFGEDSVPMMLNAANVLAISSHYESCPLIAQEALACGLPVVSVDVGRVRELVSNTLAGKIVPRDPADMTEALVSFLRSDKKHYKAACRRSVQPFSFEKTVDETLEVYEKALSKVFSLRR